MRSFLAFLTVITFATAVSATPSGEDPVDSFLASTVISDQATHTTATTAPIVWNTGSFQFVKISGGQKDCITAQTCLTRNTVLFNSVVETFSGMQGCGYLGPGNTEWAVGNIANWSTLTYQRLYLANSCSPPNMVYYPLVLHLIAENIYLQVQFNTWPGHVANFSYTRTTTASAPTFVGVAGRVTSADGFPVRNAIVTITDTSNVKRTTASSSLGYYRFENVLTGGTYTINASAKGNRFTMQVVTVSGELTSVDFAGQPGS